MSEPAPDTPWPERRFSQAVAEGDGISIIPIVRGEMEALVAAAEAAGAEAIVVESIADLRIARGVTDIPVVLRPEDVTHAVLDEARAVGADGVALRVAGLVNGNETAYAHAIKIGLDCALCVSDEEELQDALERLEPEILVAIPRARGDGDPLTRTLALLPDIPVGKLVIVEVQPNGRDDVASLERAGVDALVIEAPADADALSRVVHQLIDAEHPLD